MFNKLQYTLTSFNTFSLPLKAPDFAFVHSSYIVHKLVQGPVLLYKSIGLGQLFNVIILKVWLLWWLIASKKQDPVSSIVRHEVIKLCPGSEKDRNGWSHVLVHFVKSACLYSVNPFSTFFSANNQHNCPILFCMCPTYLPAGLAFRFSFQKQLHLHFWGKWPLAPSIFWTNKLFSQIYSPKLSNEISWYHHSYVWSSLWLACWTQQTSAAAALHPVAASVSASPPLLWHKQKYDKNYFTIFCK